MVSKTTSQDSQGAPPRQDVDALKSLLTLSQSRIGRLLKQHSLPDLLALPAATLRREGVCPRDMSKLRSMDALFSQMLAH